MQEAVGFFRNWERLGEIALAAAVVYVAIVAMVRISGKRTSGELNNFDWIITVAVGSLAASGMLLKNVAVAEALAAILTLALLQYATTWIAIRSDRFTDVVKAEPTLLVHEGRMLPEAMKRTRIAEEEICTALRENGMTDISEAGWVVLENNGRLSVIPHRDIALEDAGTLKGVERPGGPQT